MREQLVRPLARTDVAYLMPEAPRASWYAGRFNSSARTLEPELSAALQAVENAVEEAGRYGASVILVGFSQGGCLVAESIARQGAANVVGLGILTGALIGVRAEPDEVIPIRSTLSGLPVEIVSSAHDEWVPVEFVRATARSFHDAGARVQVDITDEPEHRIGPEAVRAVERLLDGPSTLSGCLGSYQRKARSRHWIAPSRRCR